MDEQQQQRINEAAQQFADAVRESYRTVVDRGESTQRLNAELTQQFYNAVINNLRSQTEEAQQMSQELREQQERQRQAAQSFTQEAVGSYMDFMSSMFSIYQGSVGEAERATEEAVESDGAGGQAETAAEQSTAEEETTEREVTAESLPLEDYDSLNVDQVADQLDDLSTEEIEQIRDYEVRHKNRRTLMERINSRLEESTSS